MTISPQPLHWLFGRAFFDKTVTAMHAFLGANTFSHQAGITEARVYSSTTLEVVMVIFQKFYLK